MEATTKRLLKDDLLVAMFRAVLERTPGAGPNPAPSPTVCAYALLPLRC